jgi:DNA-binding MarR family transcriptional regulator
MAAGLRPSIVLSDLRMPDLDGLHLARRLKELPASIVPEIIFISGHANLEDAIEAIRLGARDLIVKPVDRDKLLLSVRVALAARDALGRNGAPEKVSANFKPSQLNASTAEDEKHRALVALRSMRKVRGKYLPQELFSDPCWEMLLDLYEAQLSSEPVTVTGLGVNSGVPLSTALRRIGDLQHHGLVGRAEDAGDKRRSLVVLTEKGLQALDNFFDAYFARINP